MKEQKIQSDIVKYLESIGAYVVKVIKATRSGVPDIIACINGLFVAVEVKKKGGRVSSLQWHNIKRIQDKGGIAIVAYSVEDVEKIFKEGIDITGPDVK